MEVLGPHHIKITYNPNDGRTAFSVFRRNGPFDESAMPYIGYIIDLTDGKSVERENNIYPTVKQAPMPRILGVVPIPIIDQYVHQDVIKSKDVRVVPVSDGTTITLYWYQDRWVYSTIGSYDFGPMSWSGTVTHGDIIEDVFEKCNFDVQKLDRTRCYTIGFKGSSHPFLEGGVDPIFKMWFIRSVNVGGINEVVNLIQEEKDADDEKTYTFAEFESTDDDVGIPLQEVSEISLDDVIAKNNTAYDTYVKTGEVNLGYIVYTGGWSYLMDSDLYRYVRCIFYDAPVPGSRKERRRGNHSNVTMYPIDRQKFCILHAVLSKRHSAIFLTLFPQFKDDVDHIKTSLQNIHKSMVTTYKKYIGCEEFTSDKPLSNEPIPLSSRNRRKFSCNRRPPVSNDIHIRKEYKPLWDAMIKKIPGTRSVHIIPEMISTFIINENNAQFIYPIIYHY